MEVALGKVTAEVQQRSHGLCPVTIHFTSLPESAWRGALEIFQQQLAGGRLIEPHLAFPDSEPAFSTLGLLLFPDTTQAIQATCSCCPPAQDLRNCSAVQAVYRQLGTMLDEEPVLLLRLRGREWQQVIQALQERPQNDYAAPTPVQGTATRFIPASDTSNGREAQGDREELSAHLGDF